MVDTSTTRMPAVFIGHGSPMNALEDNVYTATWHQLAASLPRPKAILAISAHWLTRGSAVTAMAAPPTIHDFGGFPQALSELQYPAPGDPALAARVAELLMPLEVRMDQEWGLDHGVWSVLVKMYPAADIPVVQLSIDATRPTAWHYALGQRLAPLRDEGILLLGTGNVVHNLRMIAWGDQAQPHAWAERFNARVRELLQRGELAQLAEYEKWGDDARLSVPSVEHYLPLLYIAGSRHPGEAVTIPADGIALGSLSMLSAVIGPIAAD
jgi:4,5-DOPA dioxygenase extradiol